MATNRNPYKNRELPVGQLDYPLKNRTRRVQQICDKSMLELGENELLYAIPSITGGGLFANLGHARGGSAMLLASGLRELDLEGHIYSVDTFKSKSKDDISYSRAMTISNNFAMTDLITICRGTTDEWVEKLADKEFDFLFIDADHSYEGVLRDYQNWSPLVKLHGLVAFHDTNQDVSHRVLEEEVLDNPGWTERKELHVNRIRVFEKEST